MTDALTQLLDGWVIVAALLVAASVLKAFTDEWSRPDYGTAARVGLALFLLALTLGSWYIGGAA